MVAPYREMAPVEVPESSGIDLKGIRLEQLKREHPDRVRWSRVWQDYRLLYRGGHDFICSAGMSPVAPYTVNNATTSGASTAHPWGLTGKRWRRFLWQYEAEPDIKYQQRWTQASYNNYAGAIVDYFRQWLFSCPPIIRPSEGDELPDWFKPFVENADGNGTSLDDFIKASFADVLQCRYAGWMLGRADSVAEQQPDDETLILTPYRAEDMLDWQRSPCGELEWVTLRKERHERAFPEERRMIETYTFLNREQWATWECVRGESDEKAELIGEGRHDLGAVPFVVFEVPDGLWLLDKVFSPAVSLFNRQNALQWAEHMSCYVQPFLRTRETDSGKANKVWGESTVMELRAAPDGAEEVGWVAPDISPLDFLAKQISDDRDELYRIVHQMSLAVDATATKSLDRSGVSKQEDRKSSEIILKGYGQYARKAYMDTLRLQSMAHGDKTVWTFNGFVNFQVSTLDEEMQIGALAQTMNFKSVTAQKRLELKLIGRLLADEDQSTMSEIEKQTEEFYDRLMPASDMELVPDGASQIGPSGTPITPVPGTASAMGVAAGGVPAPLVVGEDANEQPKIELTASDRAAIVTVNEARKDLGLGPFPGRDGNLTISEFKSAHAQTIAEGEAAAKGQTKPVDPAEQAAAKAAAFGGKPPFVAKSGAPPFGKKDGEQAEAKPGDKANPFAKGDDVEIEAPDDDKPGAKKPPFPPKKKGA